MNFTVLTGSLARLDSSQELFLGHGLSDVDYAITHRFAPPQSLLYPQPHCLRLPPLWTSSCQVREDLGGAGVEVTSGSELSVSCN